MVGGLLLPGPTGLLPLPLHPGIAASVAPAARVASKSRLSHMIFVSL
jgi:hypothetical protein